MTRSTRLFIILGLALALVGGAAYAAVQVTKDRVDSAIPQVDLAHHGDDARPQGPPLTADPPAREMRPPRRVETSGSTA